MYEYKLKDMLNYNIFVDTITNIKKELNTNNLKVQVLTDSIDQVIDEFILDTIYFDSNDLFTQLKEIYYYNDEIELYISITK